jgi:RNA polymerase sigma-70 factor (ECF subfamily)
MTDDARERPERDAEFQASAIPHLDDVHRFALSLTRDPANADDVVQETFLRAYRSWHTFQPGTDARKWLFAIARNVYLRTLEKERRTVELKDGDTEALDALSVVDTSDRDGGADRVLSRVDLRPALQQALSDLAEPYKSTVVLVDLEDQTYDEAAQVLGVPIGTVRSRLFRGRRLLQEQLLRYAQDAGFARTTG